MKRHLQCLEEDAQVQILEIGTYPGGHLRHAVSLHGEVRGQLAHVKLFALTVSTGPIKCQ